MRSPFVWLQSRKSMVLISGVVLLALSQYPNGSGSNGSGSRGTQSRQRFPPASPTPPAIPPNLATAYAPSLRVQTAAELLDAVAEAEHYRRDREIIVPAGERQQG